MEKNKFGILIDARVGTRDSVEYVKILGSIPYAEFENAFREIFSRYGIPEDIPFSVDMELNTWEFNE